MTKNTKLALIALEVLIIAGVAYYFYREFTSSSVENPVNQTATTTRTVEIAPGIFAEVEGDVVPTVSFVPVTAGNTLKAPDLNRAITFPPSMTETDRKSFIDTITTLKTELEKDPTSFVHWNDLGIYRKQLGDYEGAEEIWIYLTKAAPQVPDAYINLGDLYMYYVHDNAKAEPMFLKVVEVAPRLEEGYRRAVDFYVTALNDKERALSFLRKSVEKYPDMKVPLEPLIKSLGE